MAENPITAARRERAAVFARDAAQALSEHDEEAKALEERTKELRRARLERDSKLKSRSTSADPAKRADRAAAPDSGPRKRPNGAHRFAVGDRVVIAVKGAGTIAARGSYRIVRQLPPDGGDNLYRIKGDQELHERVVAESRLKLDS